MILTEVLAQQLVVGTLPVAAISLHTVYPQQILQMYTIAFLLCLDGITTNHAEAGAITVLFDTNGTTVNSYSSANTSTRQIRSAVVYLNPHKWSGYSAATQKTTATHEMGHAICLGHSDDPNYYPLANSVASLMKVNHEAASTPQNHEIADVIAFYR